MKRKIQHSAYYITGDPEEADHSFHYSDAIQEQLAKYHEYIQRGNPKVLLRLIKTIKQYPNIPAFRNYLSVYYAHMGNKKKAYEINQQIVKRFPLYLIGKVNLANQAMDMEDYDKVLEILGEGLDLKLLYPERNIFHYNEFTPFMTIVTRYLLETEQYEAVESRLPLLEEVLGGDHDLVINIKNRLNPEEFLGNFEDGHSFPARGYDENLSTKKAPVYHHKIVESLVDTTLADAQQLFPKLLALDRTTLVQDLSTLLRDSLQRYHYWMDKNDADDTYRDFPVQAMILLGELEAESELPLLLDILRQGNEFLEYWYGDFLTEEWWNFLYPLSKDQLPSLVSFLEETYIYAYSKSVVLTVMVQLALHQPDRKEKVVSHFATVFENLLQQNKIDESKIDDEFCSFLVAETIVLNSPELKELSKQFYEAEMVNEWIIGSWSDIENDYQDETYPENEKKELPKSALATAQRITKKWYERN